MTKFIERRTHPHAITKPIVIFYHANCTDGFSAAWAAWKKFGDQAQYIATFHEDPPPTGVTGKEIYTLDMTFPEPITKQLIADNIRVTAIDHHVSSQAVTEMTQDYSYALEHSGAVLAWKYFHPDTPVPRMLLSVEDMDLWRFKIDGTAALYAYLDLFEFEFVGWSDLVADFEDDAKRKALLETGALLVRYEDKIIERLVRKDAHPVQIGDVVAYAINSASAFRSQMGAIMAKMSPSGIGIVWWEAGDGYIAVSLRSVGDADVAKLAGQYGGGGHMHSSGFRLASFADIPWKRI